MRFRTAVTALTGLMLLAQGLALAVVVMPARASAAQAAMTADMPCHHEQSPGAPKPKCCDEGCVGMVACATAHVALTSAPLALDSPAVRLPALAESAPALPPPPPASLLRPPIAFHA